MMFFFSLQKLVDLIVELLEELKYEAEDILLEDTQHRASYPTIFVQSAQSKGIHWAKHFGNHAQ